jgi:hypothetical protein
METNQAAAEGEERFVNIGSSIIPSAKSSQAMQPGEGALDGPAKPPQAAPMWSFSASQQGADASPHQFVSMRLRVVRSIALHEVGAEARSARFPGDGWYFIDERDQLRDIVAIRAGDFARERNALRIGDQVMLASRLAAIRGIGAGFCPPPTARTLELSMSTRDQSMASAPFRPSSRSRCNLSQTPATCQSRSRRQQVIPQPHPISCGKSSQGIPVLSTKMIPVRASRLPTGGRPPFGDSTSGGRIGSTTSHNSFETSGLAMTKSSLKPSAVTSKGRQRKPSG